MPEPLWDDEDVLQYVRSAARDGAERMRALRDATDTALFASTTTSTTRESLLQQLKIAVQAHVCYLSNLHMTCIRLPAPDEEEF